MLERGCNVFVLNIKLSYQRCDQTSSFGLTTTCVCDETSLICDDSLNSFQVDHIFLSRVCSETAGGLPGLLLTLAGIGEQGLSVSVLLI
jgi:hypothetical protein